MPGRFKIYEYVSVIMMEASLVFWFSGGDVLVLSYWWGRET